MANFFKVLDLTTQKYLDDNLEPSISIDFIQSQVFEELLALSSTDVTSYTINENRHNEILKLIDESELNFNKEFIYNSLIWLNQSYFESVQLSNDFIFCSLDKEANELENMEDVLSTYFGERGLNLKSIYFKFDHNTNEYDKKITNKLVILDIMNVIKKYGPRKTDIDSVPIKRLSDRVQYIKFVTASVLKNHLRDKNPKSSSSDKSLHRFILTFFHYAQVPVSSKDKDLIDDNPGLVANILQRWKE